MKKAKPDIQAQVTIYDMGGHFGAAVELGDQFEKKDLPTERYEDAVEDAAEMLKRMLLRAKKAEG